tara:strand:- start:989 stop:1207 length:219 start_codon:yes stop_codon:yes gene_type:complete
MEIMKLRPELQKIIDSMTLIEERINLLQHNLSLLNRKNHISLFDIDVKQEIELDIERLDNEWDRLALSIHSV